MSFNVSNFVGNLIGFPVHLNLSNNEKDITIFRFEKF